MAPRVLTRPPGDVSLMQLRYCSLEGLRMPVGRGHFGFAGPGGKVSLGLLSRCLLLLMNLAVRRASAELLQDRGPVEPGVLAA